MNPTIVEELLSEPWIGPITLRPGLRLPGLDGAGVGRWDDIGEPTACVRAGDPRYRQIDIPPQPVLNPLTSPEIRKPDLRLDRYRGTDLRGPDHMFDG